MRTATLLSIVLLVCAVVTTTLAEPPAKPVRVPWTTSRLTGSTEPPPPYRTERIFPQLAFKEPVTIATAPGSGRLFIQELGGKIFSFPDDPKCETVDLFVDLGQIKGHRRSYGLTFHPQFVKNRLVYICYVLEDGNPKGTRVSRFEVSDTDPPTVDLKSEKILLEWRAGGHNGGCLQFGPDGCLYISTGDGSNPSPPDSLNTGQDLSDLLASVLRIDVDHASDNLPYRIPDDNPFVKHEDARPEIWAYGFRNPWKMSFDRKSGSLWVGDVGWEMWEMIYRVERGGNFGWSVIEGKQSVRPEVKRGPTPILPAVVEHAHTESRSITGGRFYHGNRLKDLTGAYIYGDYVTGKLWGLRYEDGKVTWQQHLADSPLTIIDFGEGKDGELYILEHAGTLNRLIPNTTAKFNPNFPKRLSETGLFASVKEHRPAAGVLPYSINAEPWADGATAERLFAVPGTGTLGVYEKANVQIGHVKGAWIYPSDTVFAKTLSLEMERGNPSSRRRLETQILHRDGEEWRAYNYVWNDEQTDAVLTDADGFDRPLTIKDRNAPGGGIRQTWHFASRTECLICHTTRAGSILGFNVSQLNRDGPHGQQLQTLDQLGLFEKPLPNPPERLPDPFGKEESLNERARAYLHTNCAHCHRRGGGGTAPFELLYELDLKKTFLVGTRPSQGAFDIHAAANVAAGDPYRSVLYYRMAKLGSGHMPYAGSNVVDERGLDLIHEWIRRLPELTDERPDRPLSVTEDQRNALETLRTAIDRTARAQAVGRLLATSSGALYLLRAIETGRLSPAVRQEVVETANQHSHGPIRELFERFIPEEQRVQRLGSAIKPAAILALDGDARRGREVFLKSSTASCRNCHRVGNEGQEVGPDLSQIGKKYDRAQLLESILEPSKRIEPAYVTYLLETTRGTVHSGLLVRRTETEVVLKDAQAKLITVPTREIETFAAQQKSLMPELLLREFTAQEVADLLAFLTSLK